MSEIEAPNFAVLLGPYIAEVPAEGRPRFLALLERSAAERYRGWARDLPEHAEGLLACADREDEIADRIEKLFPIGPELLKRVEAPLPSAKQTYYDVFAEHSPLDQLRIQADAERQGAAAWCGIADAQSDPAVKEEIERCARLEEQSAAWVEGIL
jgi:hypothetical protein